VVFVYFCLFVLFLLLQRAHRQPYFQTAFMLENVFFFFVLVKIWLYRIFWGHPFLSYRIFNFLMNVSVKSEASPTFPFL
jgi:hypothetical protein